MSSDDHGVSKRTNRSMLLFSVPARLVFVALFLFLLTVLSVSVFSRLLRPQPVDEPAEMYRAFNAALRSMIPASKAVIDYRMSAAAPGAALPGKEAVTVADMRSHKLLTAGIEASSLIAIISEEGVEDAEIPRLHPNSRLLLYVDPLDATQEYTESLLSYVSIAACLTRCGRPVAGIVSFPFTGRTLVGVVDSHSGGSVTGTPLYQRFNTLQEAVLALDTQLAPAAFGAAAGPSPSSCDLKKAAPIQRQLSPASTTLPSITIVATRSHFRNVSRTDGWRNMREAIERLQALRPGTSLTRAGGAGYKIAEVAEGRADLYLHEGPIRKWDVCAGEALLRAAGGRITDYSGDDHKYDVSPAWWHPRDSSAPENVGVDRKTIAKTVFATTGVIASRDPELLNQVLDVIKN